MYQYSLIKKAVQRNNKLRNVSVLFVENSEHASGKNKVTTLLFHVRPIHSLRLAYSHALMHYDTHLWFNNELRTDLVLLSLKSTSENELN